MSEKKRYTIQDIARRLNTTASTVSRALQDHPRISEKMRKAVKELALELDYQPDFRALSLKTGSGRTIGVMVPHVDRFFFATVLRGIDEVATEAGYSVLICQSYESYEKEVSLTRSLLYGKVDGLIVSVASSTHDATHFESFERKGIPLVFFDRVWEPMRVSKVVIDDYLGAVKSVQHLIDNGCQEIAHFAGPQHINVYFNRTRGYIDTLKKNGLKVKEDFIFRGVITRETGCETMQSILKLEERPDAIFSSGDYSALGAMLCAKEAGIRVPEDLAFSGFANEPFDAIFDPPLTSVDQHGVEMGRQAAALLIEQMETKRADFVPRTIVINPDLIIRKSSLKRNGA
jgi:LacI family transcriptional regulator